MASLTLLNGMHPAENMINNTTCYLVTSSSNGSSYTNSLSSSSPVTNIGTHHRIAPRIPEHSHKYINNNQDLLRCKRRIQLGQLSSGGKGSNPQPAAVARRNERERNRVRLVNLGFATLRQHVPNSSKNKKMSKVDTLRSAVEYIKRLQELLGETTNNLMTGSGSVDENSYPAGGQSSTGSPTPSVCSEASSPYDLMVGDEEEDLMDFANWF
ncbi:achaete-scute homolog 1a [Parasteatoda tepidariorum]|uniref:achaete-scute homolog 1a n=1 Tax=Parasteatoda tepidariorum TaxID=114398 RepID=UPI00077FA0CD|nr:achaete-scute homolog 1a [Parasteatoda tepidariorum]